jgi:death-on-curing family protein
MVQHLTTDDVLRIHYALVELFEKANDPIRPCGPKPGGLLESAITRPQTSLGKVEKYRSVEHKAAALIHSLVGNHPFNNGNKRTALVSALIFLDRNRRLMTATDDALYDFVLAIANKNDGFGGSADDSVNAIADWIKENTMPETTKAREMKISEFTNKCEKAGCTKKETGGGVGKSVSISGSSRRLDGNVVRSYLKKLGLSQARSGIRLGEFQAGLNPEQALIRQYRAVLNKLAST